MATRQRAPQREGRRTTLRVPDSVMVPAQELAQELGTTTNDAIVRLAEQGVAAAERRRRVERLARERREAVARAGGVGAIDFPPPDELRAAMLSGRLEP